MNRTVDVKQKEKITKKLFLKSKKSIPELFLLINGFHFEILILTRSTRYHDKERFESD